MTGAKPLQAVERIILSGWAGRQFDSLAEFGMHFGIWAGVFAIGVLYGHVRDDALLLAGVALAVAVLVGLPGQIAAEWGGRDD